MPVVGVGEILGVLSLCADQRRADLTPREFKRQAHAKRMMLTRIARHYALSLANLRLREKLRLESIRDPLTGLFNRRYMEESLQREASRAKRQKSYVSIMMLDVDYFKNFNDIYGHHVGDMVLREMGDFLKKHVRGEDIACRYGGEEFLLILPNAPLPIARQRAEELRQAISALELRHEQQVLRITVSCGVAALPTHGKEIVDIVRQADAALYHAKAAGRNQVMTAAERRG